MSFTVADLMTRMKERLGDNDTFWNNVDFQYGIDEALSIWQAITGQWVEAATVTVGSNASTSPTTGKVIRVLDGTEALVQGALHELDYGYPGWESVQSTTPETWSPYGWDKIIIAPTSATSFTLSVLQLKDDVRTTTSGSTVDISDSELDAILAYAQHYCAFKEGGQEFQDTIPLLQKFQEAAGYRNRRWQKSASYRRYMGLDKDQTQRAPHAVRPDNA